MNAIKLITLIVIFFLAISTIYCETVAEPPVNFTDADVGSATNPYQITTLANLRWLSETEEVWGGYSSYLQGDFPLCPTGYKYFIQTSDIDATETVNWNYGKGFLPIGIEEYVWEPNACMIAYKMTPFIGSYNGNNHKISNLYINRQYGEEEYHTRRYLRGVGLFGIIWKSNIINVQMENASINHIISDDISDSWVKWFQGMLVGSAFSSNILNCSATGSQSNSHGLLGYLFNDCVVEYCSSVCYSDIGASLLVQFPMGSIIRNSFARGCNQVGVNYLEQLNGLTGASTLTDISNVYISSIEGELNVNWLSFAPESTVFTSYWNMETTNTPNPLEGSCYPPNPPWVSCFGLTTTQMKDPSNYNGWDFENIWGIDPDINDGYPYLRHDTIAEYLLSDTDVTITPVPSQLIGNYPNPFNPSTTIQYSLSETGRVKISVYNIKGQLVKTLINETKEAGHHTVVWNGDDSRAKKVSSGIYFYRMETMAGSLVKKMLLLK